jgi:polysaccharide export outer membrane protein
MKRFNIFSSERKQTIVIFFLVFFVIGCGGKSVESSKEINMIKAQGDLEASYLSSKYVLGASDKLQISFFRKPPKTQKEYRLHVNDKVKIDFTYYKELSTQVVVPPDGRIVLKKIGEIRIDNLTTRELTSLLKEAYSRMLKNPEIVITLVEFYSPAREFFAALKEGNQSRQVLIRRDGYINLPLLNDVQAAGLTPLELENLLQSEYNELLPELVVDVDVIEEESKKIMVLGEVKNAGVYQFLAWTTLIDAIATAGGYTDRAFLSQVLIIRRTKDNHSKPILYDVENSLSRKDSLRRFRLKPFDIVYVPKKPIVDLGIALNDIYRLFPPWFPWPLDRE